MFGALRDCVLPLKQARHDPPEVMLDAFNQEISKHFDEVNVFMVDESRIEQCCDVHIFYGCQQYCSILLHLI